MPTKDGIMAQLVALRDQLAAELLDVEAMIKAGGPKKHPQSGDGENICPICAKRFKTTAALGSHKLAVHNIEGQSRRAQDRHRKRLSEMATSTTKREEDVSGGREHSAERVPDPDANAT